MHARDRACSFSHSVGMSLYLVIVNWLLSYCISFAELLLVGISCITN